MNRLDAEEMDGGTMGDQSTHSVELMNVRHSNTFNTIVGDYRVKLKYFQI